MIDLRPVSDDWPMEVVVAGEPVLAGYVDGTLLIEDQIASDAAIAIVSEQGIFQRETRACFNIAFYWISPVEMEEYFATEWKNSAVLPDRVRDEARRLCLAAGSDARIRVLKSLEIGRYRRLSQ